LKQTLFLTSKTNGFDTFQYNLFNDPIFQFSPFWVWGKKAEKSQKNLISQIKIRFNNLEKRLFILDILRNLINCITTIQYL
jgi:hypothetical protein